MNSTPYGLCFGRTQSNSPIMKLISPMMMKTGRINSRTLVGPMTLPSGPNAMIERVERAYRLWYRVYNDTLVPQYLMEQQPKWFDTSKDLVVGDVVFFRKGTIFEIVKSSDKIIRRVTVKYTNPTEEAPRFTDRSVRSVVKLFSLEDGTWQDEMEKVKRMLAELGDDVTVTSSKDYDVDVLAEGTSNDNTAPHVKKAGDTCTCCCDSHCEVTAHPDSRPITANLRGLRNFMFEMDSKEYDAYPGWDYMDDGVFPESLGLQHRSYLDLHGVKEPEDAITDAAVSLDIDLSMQL